MKINKEETLLILRAYINHPTSWHDVLDEVKRNTDVLTPGAREIYTTGSTKQLRDRMSGKLGSLVKKRPEEIPDADIRYHGLFLFIMIQFGIEHFVKEIKSDILHMHLFNFDLTQCIDVNITLLPTSAVRSHRYISHRTLSSSTFFH